MRASKAKPHRETLAAIGRIMSSKEAVSLVAVEKIPARPVFGGLKLSRILLRGMAISRALSLATSCVVHCWAPGRRTIFV